MPRRPYWSEVLKQQVSTAPEPPSAGLMPRSMLQIPAAAMSSAATMTSLKDRRPVQLSALAGTPILLVVDGYTSADAGSFSVELIAGPCLGANARDAPRPISEGTTTGPQKDSASASKTPAWSSTTRAPGARPRTRSPRSTTERVVSAPRAANSRPPSLVRPPVGPIAAKPPAPMTPTLAANRQRTLHSTQATPSSSASMV